RPGVPERNQPLLVGSNDCFAGARQQGRGEFICIRHGSAPVFSSSWKPARHGCRPSSQGRHPPPNSGEHRRPLRGEGGSALGLAASVTLPNTPAARTCRLRGASGKLGCFASNRAAAEGRSPWRPYLFATGVTRCSPPSPRRLFSSSP